MLLPPNAHIVQAPSEAPDPAALCERWASLQHAMQEAVPAPGPPVLWLSQAPLQLARGGFGDKARSAPFPLWWAGRNWKEFALVQNAPHAVGHAAYVPRRFEPPWHNGGGLLRVVEAPLEMGPSDEASPVATATTSSSRLGTAMCAAAALTLGNKTLMPHEHPSSKLDRSGTDLLYGSTNLISSKLESNGNGVFRMFRALLCERGGKLLARPLYGGHWTPCPCDLGDFRVDRAQGFEFSDGERYIVISGNQQRRGGPGGPDKLVMYDVAKNRWMHPVGPSRNSAGGHAGDPPVLWRPIQTPRLPSHDYMLRAWVIEASSEWLVLLGPVSRDGLQRGTAEDKHAAVHFFGHNREVVTHHLACAPSDLTVQRYDQYFLFAKDESQVADPDMSIMDDDACDALVAGWLLPVEDIAIPPLPIHLPRAHEVWQGDICGWSLAIVRGCNEDLAETANHRTSTASRMYLFECGPAVMRLWVSRPVDEALTTRYERHTLDGMQHVRHALCFKPVPGSDLNIRGVHDADSSDATALLQQDVAPSQGFPTAAETILSPSAPALQTMGAPSLWSPDLRHVVRMGRRPTFWRCGVAFHGDAATLRSSANQAHAAPAEIHTDISTAECHPLKPMSWSGIHRLPAELARNNVIVDGLPSYPRFRWSEATVHRPEDKWFHTIGRDTAQHPPAFLLR